jgi:rhomboid protease GluP
MPEPVPVVADVPHLPIPSLDELLRRRLAHVRVTQWLIGINVAVFVAMLFSGAGLWHSPNGVQLEWGANFGPATQDGQWWRLASALFLHFGVLHLLLNMWALWDGGQLVERMFGSLRFAVIYFASGIFGNLLSLVSHHGHAVSGGASGAIFGVYGALLVCLWRERRLLHPDEFRWLFWGAAAFAVASIAFGVLVAGIDNAAHVGGFFAGLLGGVVLATPLAATAAAASAAGRRPSAAAWSAAGALLLAVLALLGQLPEPAYRWRDEVEARREISEFIADDAAIGRAWQDIVRDSGRGGASFDELAGRIDAAIGDRYEESFEELSLLPANPALPSAAQLENLRRYAERRRDASRSLADALRSGDADKIRAALAAQARALQRAPEPSPAKAAPGGGRRPEPAPAAR